MFKADLHVHSTESDGSMAPKELIDLALEKGLSALSITDHDTIRAYSGETLSYAQEKGVLLLPGVEFSCKQRDRSVHILGLGVDPESMPLQKLCKRHEERRAERNVAIIENLHKAGKPVEIKGREPSRMGRVHIALAMVERGYVSDIREAFALYIGDGKSCCESCTSFDVQLSIDVIKQAGGRAIIAHPHLIRNHKILRDLLEMDFDGIECYYANFDDHSNSRWLRLAQEKEWLVSGGSDFHGSYKKTIDLGASWVSREEYERLND